MDRSTSAGEFGVEGKSLVNLEAIPVRLVGARYESHGTEFNPVAVLARVDHTKSFGRIKETPGRHASELVAFTLVAYHTPGYGATEKDKNGIPGPMKLMSQLSDQFHVPIVLDSAMAPPVLTPSPRDHGADIMLCITDKAVTAPISGLIVGEVEIVVPVRIALDLGGE